MIPKQAASVLTGSALQQAVQELQHAWIIAPRLKSASGVGNVFRMPRRGEHPSGSHPGSDAMQIPPGGQVAPPSPRERRLYRTLQRRVLAGLRVRASQ